MADESTSKPRGLRSSVGLVREGSEGAGRKVAIPSAPSLVAQGTRIRCMLPSSYDTREGVRVIWATAQRTGGALWLCAESSRVPAGSMKIPSWREGVPASSLRGFKPQWKEGGCAQEVLITCPQKKGGLKGKMDMFPSPGPMHAMAHPSQHTCLRCLWRGRNTP